MHHFHIANRLLGVAISRFRYTALIGVQNECIADLVHGAQLQQTVRQISRKLVHLLLHRAQRAALRTGTFLIIYSVFQGMHNHQLNTG